MFLWTFYDENKIRFSLLSKIKIMLDTKNSYKIPIEYRIFYCQKNWVSAESFL